MESPRHLWVGSLRKDYKWTAPYIADGDTMLELRGDITRRLTPDVLDKINQAPKPTRVAEVLAVTRQLPGIAVTFEEIAELINLADPGRAERADPRNYDAKELRKHPELLLEQLPSTTFVRYVASRAVNRR